MGGQGGTDLGVPSSKKNIVGCEKRGNCVIFFHISHDAAFEERVFFFSFFIIG